jgi:K+-sensing histidine kinase KdpD
MQRREFLSTCLGGLGGAAPFAAPGDGPAGTDGARDFDRRALAARCEQLSSQVEQLLGQVRMLGRELAEAERCRSQMLLLVHGMRSPLACMQIRAEVMRHDPQREISDELARALEMNVRNCELLNELVNDVFALARSQRTIGAA